MYRYHNVTVLNDRNKVMIEGGIASTDPTGEKIVVEGPGQPIYRYFYNNQTYQIKDKAGLLNTFGLFENLEYIPGPLLNRIVFTNALGDGESQNPPSHGNVAGL